MDTDTISNEQFLNKKKTDYLGEKRLKNERSSIEDNHNGKRLITKLLSMILLTLK